LNLSFFPFKPPLGGLFHFKKALAMTPARAFIFITSLASNTLHDVGLKPPHCECSITALLRGASNNNSDQSGNLDYLPLQILP
jgi:hypothetical protein